MQPTSSSELLAAAQEQLARKLMVVADHFLAPLHARREALLRVVAQEFSVPVEELTGGVSSHAVLPARRVAVALAVETLCPPFTREVIAGFFNISDATLYRFIATVRRREADDPSFAGRMKALRPCVHEALKLPGEQEAHGGN